MQRITAETVRQRWIALGVGVLVLASGTGWGQDLSEPAVVAIPYPTLQKLESGIQEQLTAERQFMDEVVAGDELSPVERGLAYGGMGQLYLTYDLLDAAAACFDNATLLLPEDFRWLYYRGVIDQLQGDVEAALERFRRASELNPEDLAVRLRSAEVLIDQQDLEAARSVLEGMLRTAPDSAAAYAALGRVESAKGNLEEAIAHFARALELQPEADSLHYQLGLAYRRLGDLEAAQHHLQLNGPTEVVFPDPLLEQLEGLRRSARGVFESAVQALESGEIEQAIDLLEASLALNDGDALVHHTLGLALAEQGSHEQAVAEFERALELNANYSQSYSALGSNLARLGRFEEAAKRFEEAHRLDPSDPQAQLDWATTLSLTGDTDGAARELESLLAADPGNTEARLHLGILQASLGDSQAARRNLREVLASRGAVEWMTLAHHELAQLAEREGEVDTAVSHYEAIVELRPSGVDAREALALALGRTGRFEESAEQFEQLIGWRPEQARFHFGRAMALLMGQHYQAARTGLEQSHATLPDEIALTHLLARFLVTCPVDTLRNGERGLSLADRVWSAQPSSEHAATKAMALAEVGRFEEAELWQAKVIEALEQERRPAELEKARRHQESYRQREPAREPWIR